MSEKPKKSKDYLKNKKAKKKCLLMYSGGVDTSIAVVLLKEYYGYQVITASVDLGQDFQDPKKMGEKALKLGASRHVTIDAKKEFAYQYVLKSLWANAYYDEKYCLSTSIARPLTAKKAIEFCLSEKIDAIAHGCKGRGADAFRLNMVFRFLAPSLPVVLPIHDWNPSREEEAEFAHKRNIPIPVSWKNPFSYDENLWGVAINYGTIDDIEKEVPESAYKWTANPKLSSDSRVVLNIYFEKGLPISVNGKKMSFPDLIMYLNKTGGKHGIGRKDMIENGLYGNKFRWVYESPAADILITVHKELEKVVLPKDSLYFKEQIVDKKWADLVYNAFWYTPLMEGLNEFLQAFQTYVSGSVTLELYKGCIQVKKRSSVNSLIKGIVKEGIDMVPFGYEEYLFSSIHKSHVRKVLG